MDDDARIREREERLARTEAALQDVERSSVTFGEVVTLLAVFVLVLLFLPLLLVLGLVLGFIALVMRLLDRLFGAPRTTDA